MTTHVTEEMSKEASTIARSTASDSLKFHSSVSVMSSTDDKNGVAVLNSRNNSSLEEQPASERPSKHSPPARSGLSCNTPNVSRITRCEADTRSVSLTDVTSSSGMPVGRASDAVRFGVDEEALLVRSMSYNQTSFSNILPTKRTPTLYHSHIFLTLPFMLPSTSNLAAADGDNTSYPDALPNEPEGHPTPDVPPIPPLTRRQKITLIILAFANFCSTVVFSMIAPFFPEEAQLKGASKTEIGLIFGVFELCILVSSPIFGIYMNKVGPKRLYTTGMLITGISALLFGFLNRLPPGRVFVALCFAVRCIEAVGDSAYVTAAFTIIAVEFPGRVATMIGVLETFSGLGFMAGPAVGGALYAAGGFGLPFYIAGSLLLCAGFLSMPLIPSLKFESCQRRRSIIKLLRLPTVALMMGTIVITAVSIGFIDPTLQPHLKTFNLSAVYIGLMFVLISGVYTSVAPFLGCFIDKKGHGMPVAAGGSILMIFGFMLVGPSPLLPLPSELWIIGLGLALIGLGISGQVIPPFNECLEAAKKNGYKDNFQLYGMVSGLFHGAWSAGAFLGPTTIGGFVTELTNFQTSSSICAGLHTLLLIVLLAYIYWDCRKAKQGLTSG